MVEGIQIKGGAGAFEAALIAVVLDHLTRDEDTMRRLPPGGARGLSAWMRAELPEEPDTPLELVEPDRF
ncbi:MAG: hypothetical protein WD895_04935 [Acidimicrobiia bacterium]